MTSRRLILFRHGKSAWPQSVADHERPLGERGTIAVPLMARWLARSHGAPERVIVSSARRTQQTWAHIAPLFPGLAFTTEPRVYEANVEGLMGILRSLAGDPHSILIVGHNPGMQELALTMCGTPDDDADARARLRRKFPTSGVAVLAIDGSWREVSPGCARLEQFVTPAMLGGIDED